MVSGLYEPSAGSFVFQGQDITKYGAHKRAQMGIGRTFQNIRLFDTMSAGENVLAGMHRSEEHTSELQSRQYLVCRLLLEKKKHHFAVAEQKAARLTSSLPRAAIVMVL